MTVIHGIGPRAVLMCIVPVVMPERHADPGAHGREPLNRNGQDEQCDGKRAEQAFQH